MKNENWLSYDHKATTMGANPEQKVDADSEERAAAIDGGVLSRPQTVVTGSGVREQILAVQGQEGGDAGAAVVAPVDPATDRTEPNEDRLELAQLYEALNQLGMLLIPPGHEKLRNETYVIIFPSFSPAPYRLGNNEDWFLNLRASDIRFLFGMLRTVFEDTNLRRLRRIEEYLEARRRLPDVDSLIMELNAIA